MHQAAFSAERASERVGYGTVHETAASIYVSRTTDMERAASRIVDDHQFRVIEKVLEVVRAPVVHAEFVCAGEEFATSDLRFRVSIRERLEQEEVLPRVTQMLEFIAVAVIECLPPRFRVANKFCRDAVNEGGWEWLHLSLGV